MKEMEKVTVPYVGIERVVRVLDAAIKEEAKEITITELASLLGHPSSVRNVFPTLSLLGLAEVRKRGVIAITSNGIEFINSFKSGEMGKAREIIKKGVENSEVLKFVKALLETRVQLTGEEIGRAISDRFSKNWKNLRSYQVFGRSCASLLGFAGFGFYRNGLLSSKPITTEAEAGPYTPEVGYLPIVQSLNALYPFAKAKISDLTKKLKISERGVSKRLHVCIALNLVERDVADSFKITENGIRIIDPLLSKAQKTLVFRKCLLNSPYSKIILKISQTGKELKYEDVGESLAYFMRREWNQATKKHYGKKFVTWLTNAGLVEKIGRNRFKLLKIGEITEGIKAQELEKAQIVNTAEIYELGRLLGTLEVLTPIEENEKEFEDKISALKMLVGKRIDLELALDLLRRNFQLAVKTKNPSIYRGNIELIRNKVKEKWGMFSS